MSCYWCGEKLNNKSFKRYIEKVKIEVNIKGKKKTIDKHIYGHFCDELCEYCYVFNRRITKPSYALKTLGKYNYASKKQRQCEVCGVKGSTKDFSFKSIVRVDNSSKTKSCVFCSEKCLRLSLDKNKR